MRFGREAQHLTPVDIDRFRDGGVSPRPTPKSAEERHARLEEARRNAFGSERAPRLNSLRTSDFNSPRLNASLRSNSPRLSTSLRSSPIGIYDPGLGDTEIALLTVKNIIFQHVAFLSSDLMNIFRTFAFSWRKLKDCQHREICKTVCHIFRTHAFEREFRNDQDCLSPRVNKRKRE